MHIAYNYTELKKRDKKIYSISGTTISQTGMSVNFIKIWGICFILFQIIGGIICLIKGELLYVPFRNGELKPNFLIIMILIPSALSALLHYVKIQTYRLIDYLIGYFKKKATINEMGRPIRHIKYKQKTLVENVF